MTCLLLVLCLACARSAPPTDFESHMAAALATRAEELLEAGEDDRARDAAERALQRAVSSGARTAEARALHVLGLLDGDLSRLQRALDLLQNETPSPALWRQRNVLAELALEQQLPQEVLRLVTRNLAESADWPNLEARMRSEAHSHHLRGQALAQLDRGDEAFGAERQASLALSVLDDADQLPLRRAVAQSLGDAYALRSDPVEAFEQHSLAGSLAQGLGLSSEEFLAVSCMSRDLVHMGRWLDAADHARRGVRLARQHLSPAHALQLGHEALTWLDGDSSAEADAHRAALRATLAGLEPRGG